MNADDQGNPKNKAQHFHGGRRSHDSGTNYYSSETSLRLDAQQITSRLCDY